MQDYKFELGDTFEVYFTTDHEPAWWSAEVTGKDLSCINVTYIGDGTTHDYHITDLLADDVLIKNYKTKQQNNGVAGTVSVQDFIQQAIRTESDKFYDVNPRILHAAIGCVTEAGELIDAIKKSVFYGKELDLTNIKEEAGDILWYLAILFDTLGTDFETEMSRVINKLKVRFPDKFTEQDAEVRNLDLERTVLEHEV